MQLENETLSADRFELVGYVIRERLERHISWSNGTREDDTDISISWLPRGEWKRRTTSHRLSVLYFRLVFIVVANDWQKFIYLRGTEVKNFISIFFIYIIEFDKRITKKYILWITFTQLLNKSALKILLLWTSLVLFDVYSLVQATQAKQNVKFFWNFWYFWYFLRIHIRNLCLSALFKSRW